MSFGYQCMIYFKFDYCYMPIWQLTTILDDFIFSHVIKKTPGKKLKTRTQQIQNWEKCKTELPNTYNQLIYNQINVQSKKDSSTPCKLEKITFSFSIWHSAELPETTPLLYPLTRLEAQFVFSANQGTLVFQFLKI